MKQKCTRCGVNKPLNQFRYRKFKCNTCYGLDNIPLTEDIPQQPARAGTLGYQWFTTKNRGQRG